MKINLIKIIYIVLFIITSMFFCVSPVSAVSMVFDPIDRNVGLEEEFYVDLKLDAEGLSVNGIQGYINFASEYLSFVRAEDNKSMISLWIEKPKLIDNEIIFSGLIPNGFSGVIDPYNKNHKLPGLMLRLVFKAKKPGQVNLNTREIDISLNDGIGTMERVLPISSNINISNNINNVVYKNKSDIPPELDAYVFRDHNFFDDKYVLIYKAFDRYSGVKEILIKEGDRDWVKIEDNSYILEDQKRNSIIIVKAVNYDNIEVFVKIDPLPHKFFFYNYFLILLGLLIILLVFFFKRKYANKNKK